MASAEWRPFCLDLNVLNYAHDLVLPCLHMVTLPALVVEYILIFFRFASLTLGLNICHIVSDVNVKDICNIDWNPTTAQHKPFA